jgi:plastocyanin
MRKGMWSAAAAFVVLLSAAGVVLGIPRATAADSQVKMVEGSQSDYTTWRFAPEEITVPVGSTVVWHNDGKQQHTATAKDGSFDSPYLNTGETFQFKFSVPGDVKYVCKPHESLGMVGVVHVTGAAPTTPATTATTQPSPAPTATTAVGSASTTTTTAKAGSTSSTTTTATTVAGGSTTTTLAPAVTPTSAPDSASSTTTTTTAAGTSQEGAQAAQKRSKSSKSSPVGIAFASLATLLLGAVSVKLLASKP